MPCQCKTDKQRAKCANWIGPEAGMVEKNDATGEFRASVGCFPEVMLRFMTHVMRTNVSAAAAVESNRNEVAIGLARVAQAVREKVIHDDNPAAERAYLNNRVDDVHPQIGRQPRDAAPNGN